MRRVTWTRSESELLVTKSGEGIDARGAYGRGEHGEQGNEKEDCADGGERLGIRWRHAIQEVSEETVRRKDEGGSRGETEHNGRSALAEDKPEQVSGLCADCFANAKFGDTPRDELRDDAIETDGREEKGGECEESEDDGAEARIGKLLAKLNGERLDFTDWNCRVGSGDFGLDVLCTVAANGELHGGTRLLRHGPIEDWRFDPPGLVHELGVLCVADDPYDGEPLHVAAADADPAADGIAIGEILGREGLVDDSDLPGGGRVGIGEDTAGTERDAEEVEEFGTDGVAACVVDFCAFDDGLVLALKRLIAADVWRELRRKGRAGNAFEEPLVDVVASADAGGEDSVRVVAEGFEAHVEGVREEEHRADEQDERQGHLDGDDGPGESLAAMNEATAGGLEVMDEIDTPGANGRESGEEQRCGKGKDDAERKNRKADADIVLHTELDGADRSEDANGGSGEAYSEGGTPCGEQKAFTENLSTEAELGRAECGAHSELALTAGKAGEEEVGYVEAGDQQDKEYGGKDEEERGAEVGTGESGELAVEVADDGLEVAGFDFLMKGAVDADELRLGLRSGDAGPKATEDADEHIVLAGREVRA